MTDVETIRTTSNSEIGHRVAELLTPVVHDLTALLVNGKQAHWHVRGTNFIAVHELLDTVADHARDWADLAAERVVAFRIPVDARLRVVAANASAPEPPAGFLQAGDTIHAVIASVDAALHSVNRAVKGLATIDPISQDVAIEIGAGLDKDRWFLFSHISQ
ncbi:Dps family protein [Leifsonia sp. P73]|uniref:Dps family protein n=1 Tax=Leifsonia sp. P73 TaxID=3423959 RepID=UPI003DA1EE19